MPLINPDDPATWANEWRLSGGVYGGKRVTCGYIRKLVLPTIADLRADKLIEHFSLTASSIVWICGGDYGWLHYCLEQKLPGILVRTIDGSSLIQQRAIKTETDEIEGYLLSSGLVKGTDEFNEAMSVLDDGQNKSLVSILESVVSLTRQEAMKDDFRRFGVKEAEVPNLYVCDGAFPWLDDAEALDTFNGMLTYTENVVSIIALKDDSAGYQTPGLNWKTLQEWKNLFGDYPIMPTGDYGVY